MTDTSTKTLHAVIRDPFGVIVAEGDLHLSSDTPVSDRLTWHEQLRDLLPGTPMKLLGSAPSMQLLFDLQVRFND